MNETYIHGVLHIYSQTQADTVQKTIDELDDNFFNLSYHKTHLKNAGSILIPFAKLMRADLEDLIFFEKKISNMLVNFYWLGIFGLTVYVDSHYHGKFNYDVVYNGEGLLWTKFRIELKKLNE